MFDRSLPIGSSDLLVNTSLKSASDEARVYNKRSDVIMPVHAAKRRAGVMWPKILFLIAAVNLLPPVQAETRSLPYVAVHNPHLIAASAATFLHDNDRVIGVLAGKSARAYPAAILAQHGLVEDQSPDGPIAVTW
jgi:hypothetical protein